MSTQALVSGGRRSVVETNESIGEGGSNQEKEPPPTWQRKGISDFKRRERWFPVTTHLRIGGGKGMQRGKIITSANRKLWRG